MTDSKRRPHGLALVIILIAVWTAELWLCQEATLVATFKKPAMVVTRQLFRLGLDLSVVALLVLTVPRRALYALFAVEVPVYILGSVYYDYYGRLPKLGMAFAQGGEGMAILPLVIGMIPAGRAALFVVVALGKAALLYWADKRGAFEMPSLHLKFSRLGSVALYALLFVIANLTFDPISNMKRWGTANRFGMTYGFSVPLIAESYYSSSSSLLERALESAEESTDRLSAVEGDITVYDRIVFLQVESLDYGVIDHVEGGSAVTPTFNALKDKSMFYKAEAAHFTGSADADFVALMGRWPSHDIVTYKIDNYPLEDSFVRDLEGLGFDTVAIHGVTGAFFSRREAYEKMGFSTLLFREELSARGVPSRHEKYDWIQDGELFDFAGRYLAADEPPFFHFVITVTSHSPFVELPPDERKRCARWGSIPDQYFCSMRYVDRGFKEYLSKVPDGTTLVVYGDHNSSVELDGYQSGRKGDRDWVPVFIYNHPEGLVDHQETRGMPIATDGTLTFVDVMRYVHGQIRRVHQRKTETRAQVKGEL